jgi:hypothetical protein
MKKIVLLLAAVIILGSVEDSFAQMNRRNIKKNNRRISSFRGKKNTFNKQKRYNTIGISVSALNYFGDLSPKPSSFSTDISFTRPAIGLSFTHRFGPPYALKGNFMFGTLRGSDNDSADPDDLNGKSRYVRNLSFRNQIKELSLVGVVDVYKNESTYISRVKGTPYGFLGVAVFHHNPQAKAPATDLNGQPLAEAGEWVNLRPLGTEGQYANLDPSAANNGIKKYSSIQIAIPFGAGVRFRINEVFDFEAEIGFRYLFTDYIDDVSKSYVDLSELDGELARAMSYRSGELSAPISTGVDELLANTYVASSGYTVVGGYGDEFPGNVRGNKDDKDIFMVTTFRLTYIIGKSFHRAKFR